MKLMLLPTVMILLVSVPSCQVPFSPDSPLTPVPVQSRLVLHQTLSIPPHHVSLWFQVGKQVPEKLLDRYYPHCKFETLAMKNESKSITPDTFIIHKVVRWDDYAMQPVKLAQARFGVGIGINDDLDGGPSFVNVATEMFLKSDKQADVYRLVCSQWEDPTESNHVTINQIRRTLGNIFTLELPVNLQTDEK